MKKREEEKEERNEDKEEELWVMLFQVKATGTKC